MGAGTCNVGLRSSFPVHPSRFTRPVHSPRFSRPDAASIKKHSARLCARLHRRGDLRRHAAGGLRRGIRYIVTHRPVAELIALDIQQAAYLAQQIDDALRELATKAN